MVIFTLLSCFLVLYLYNKTHYLYFQTINKYYLILIHVFSHLCNVYLILFDNYLILFLILLIIFDTSFQNIYNFYTQFFLQEQFPILIFSNLEVLKHYLWDFNYNFYIFELQFAKFVSVALFLIFYSRFKF